MRQETNTEPAYSILLEENDGWAVQRARYITLENTAPISDDSIVRPPFVAT